MGFFIKKEILTRMVNDTSAIGISETQIKQLLMEKN